MLKNEVSKIMLGPENEWGPVREKCWMGVSVGIFLKYFYECVYVFNISLILISSPPPERGNVEFVF